MIKRGILFFLFCSIISLGFFLSYNSIPNQEGYFEGAWLLSHGNFTQTILSPAVTPLNFFVGFALERILHVSTANAWKIMDLVFSGLLGVFLIHIYWEKHRPKNISDLFFPPLTILSSVGFLYYFTSMSGEGMPVFFAVTGIYYWQKRSFTTACLLFILSFLSKFTLYLIAPGMGLWLLFNLKSYSRQELKQIGIAAILFLSVFFAYNTIKQWGDIKLQVAHINSFPPQIVLYNFPYYFVAILLSAPLIVLFSLSNPSITSLFWIAALSCFVMLIRRYFYWNHPQQIVAFLMLYFFTHPQSKNVIHLRYIFLQIIFSICLIALLLSSIGSIFFPAHMTKQESFAIDGEIMKDYHGGKVGYYLNRRFDEPFPNYEISYMEPNWDFVVEDTEYIVVPAGLIPEQIVRHKQCRLIYYSVVAQNIIYKVTCEKKAI